MKTILLYATIALLTSCVSSPNPFGKRYKYRMNEEVHFEQFSIVFVAEGQVPDRCHGGMASYRDFKITIDDKVNEVRYQNSCLVLPIHIETKDSVFVLHPGPIELGSKKGSFRIRREDKKYLSQMSQTPLESGERFNRNKYEKYKKNPPSMTEEEAEARLMQDPFDKEAMYAVKAYAYISHYDNKRRLEL